MGWESKGCLMSKNEKLELSVELLKNILNNNLISPRSGRRVTRNDILNMIKNANIDHQFLSNNLNIVDGLADAVSEISEKKYRLIMNIKKENFTIIFSGEDQFGNKIILSCVDCF